MKDMLKVIFVVLMMGMVYLTVYLIVGAHQL
jgi:hypothetical protein